MTHVRNCGFELPQQYPNSPDAAPSDFYLFPKLESHLSWRQFGNNHEIISAVEQYLRDQDATFFHEGIVMLEHCWTKCIDVNGDYITIH